MSRIPRVQEHLKTGFTAEAVSAAKYRAYAERAEEDGKPNLAAHWRDLAEEKDRLARLQLEAAGKIRGGATDIGAETAEERYENDVLYPKLQKLVGEDGHSETRDLFGRVIEAQRDHLQRLLDLRTELQGSRDDVSAPGAD